MASRFRERVPPRVPASKGLALSALIEYVKYWVVSGIISRARGLLSPEQPQVSRLSSFATISSIKKVISKVNPRHHLHTQSHARCRSCVFEFCLPSAGLDKQSCRRANSIQQLRARSPCNSRIMYAVLDHRLAYPPPSLPSIKQSSISTVCAFFRQALVSKAFTELYSTKLQVAGTESGAAVFKVNYFRRPAFLT
jgi:hypothetical protein